MQANNEQSIIKENKLRYWKNQDMISIYPSIHVYLDISKNNKICSQSKLQNNCRLQVGLQSSIPIQIWLNPFSCHKWSIDNNAGPRFTNAFSIAIQIRWKFRFTLTMIIIQWLQQSLVYGTTAVLSWHVPKFVAISLAATELQQGEVFIVFELRAKFASETGHDCFECVSFQPARFTSVWKSENVDTSQWTSQESKHIERSSEVSIYWYGASINIQNHAIMNYDDGFLEVIYQDWCYTIFSTNTQTLVWYELMHYSYRWYITFSAQTCV